jgi:hypothetical protein
MTESVVVHQLSKTYGRARSTRRGGSGLVRAVDGISLTVHPRAARFCGLGPPTGFLSSRQRRRAECTIRVPSR